jgi:PAS domain S-box-containing protein
LQRQTATAGILQVIANSPSDVQPVFDAVAERAMSLLDCWSVIVVRFDGEYVHFGAARGALPDTEHFARQRYQSIRLDRASLLGRSLLERTVVSSADAQAEPDPQLRDYARKRGLRAVLVVPLLRVDRVEGALVLTRAEPGLFAPREIELVQTFADQAVIAIENARLFDEVQAKTRDLTEALEQQTATADVLKLISRSTFDLQPVLDTLTQTAARLCNADAGSIWRQDGDVFRAIGIHGFPEDITRLISASRLARGRGTVTARTVLEGRPVHIVDVRKDPDYTWSEIVERAGLKAMLGVPLMRQGMPIGAFSLHRMEARPFTDKQIELVTTFADQAVIAIENARLIGELRDRQAELRVTFDNMGDGVVMFDSGLRLTAWNRNFQQMLELPDAFLAGRPSYIEYFRYLAERGEYSADLEAELSRRLHETDQELRLERTRPDGRVIEVRRNPVPGGGFVLIYADITERKRAEEAIRAARDAAETALRDLQAAQASLVHAQKMAALGQLTAGIAHEIKNPLNFVNNFAALSVELLDELKEAAAQAIGALDADRRAEILETIRTLAGNLKKIAEHGRRADGIVRAMLQHSRGGSGDWQATDLNALVEETLNLAYHGARAQDQDFKVSLELVLDRNLAPIDVVPQDVSRVLLNLISNGFYAVTKRSREGNGAFTPVLKIATRELGEGIEIRVRDNGVGIPPEYREKLFQPFFTTKPTGEGTGLGLSISYEIVIQQHGGTITVDSQVGDFTEFSVWLPRRRHAVA